MKSPNGQERSRTRRGSKQMGSERRPKVKGHHSPDTRETWPKVAIIVLNWNGWQDTIECLESLQRITYPNYQIVVVDNGSTDDSIEKIKAWARGEIPVESKFFEYDHDNKPVQCIEYDRETAEAGGIAEEEARVAGLPPNRRFILIQTGENLGFAGGNNVGIRHAVKAGYQYVCLLNNDTVAARNFLDEMVIVSRSNPKAGILGPKIYYYHDQRRIWFAGGAMLLWTGSARHYKEGVLDLNSSAEARFSPSIGVDFVTGCCMLVKSSFVQDIGLLDEDFFLYFEDVDFCHRACRAGWTLRICLGSHIWHKVNSIIGKGEEAWYHHTKSRLHWMLKKIDGHFGAKTAFVLFFSFSRVIKLLTWMLKCKWAPIKGTCRAIYDFVIGV